MPPLMSGERGHKSQLVCAHDLVHMLNVRIC